MQNHEHFGFSASNQMSNRNTRHTTTRLTDANDAPVLEQLRVTGHAIKHEVDQLSRKPTLRSWCVRANEIKIQMRNMSKKNLQVFVVLLVLFPRHDVLPSPVLALHTERQHTNGLKTPDFVNEAAAFCKPRNNPLVFTRLHMYSLRTAHHHAEPTTHRDRTFMKANVECS